MDPNYRKFCRVFCTGYSRPSRHSDYGRAKYLDQITVTVYEAAGTGVPGFRVDRYNTWLVDLNFSSN